MPMRNSNILVDISIEKFWTGDLELRTNVGLMNKKMKSLEKLRLWVRNPTMTKTDNYGILWRWGNGTWGENRVRENMESWETPADLFLRQKWRSNADVFKEAKKIRLTTDNTFNFLFHKLVPHRLTYPILDSNLGLVFQHRQIKEIFKYKKVLKVHFYINQHAMNID